MRQCVELGLELEEETKKSIAVNYTLLNKVIDYSIHRVTEELLKMLVYHNASIINFFFVSGISKLLGIPEIGLFYILKCQENNLNFRIKIACLLSAHYNDKAEEWVNKFKLSTVTQFHKDNGFIRFIKIYYKSFEKVNDEITIRKLIQNAEKIFPNRGVEYVYDLIRYHGIITGEKYRQNVRVI